ncbi:hypothetical protein ACFSTH_15780 [Paenibacillus yanchengensis]|uniref:Uncharacterized protein n=1 Tax=Paenibacillus yanchengensis TaxID=2035833 RepID=A0ABW4YFX9_9BACL
MQRTERMIELLQASKQITDHMERNDQAANQLMELNQLLQHLVAEMNDDHYDEKYLLERIRQAKTIVANMENTAENNYLMETSGDIDKFESLSIEEQAENNDAYHEKIDYLSLKKVNENMDKIMTMIESH